MLFYVLLLGAAPILGVFCISYVATYLCSILKTALIGIAAIVLLPRLLSVAPVIIVLATLVPLVHGTKRIVGSLLG